MKANNDSSFVNKAVEAALPKLGSLIPTGAM